MGFLVPAFLAGLVALAVPVILHLRHREKEKPFRFPSLMFLERIPIRTAHRRRITDWLLLALRAAAVILLVVAFARPFLGRRAAGVAGEQTRAVVLLLDRSLSMSHRDVWPAALDSARRILAGLGAGDRVAVVQFDEEAVVAQPLTEDHAAARAAVESTRPGSRGTRYVAALRVARQVLLGAPDAEGEVLVVTDLQRSGVAGLAGLDLPSGLVVRAVPVAPRDRGNTAITGVEIQRLQDGERARLAVQVRMVTRELAAARRVRLTLTLNGRESGTRDVTLPATGSLPIAFDPVPMPAGRVQAVITAEADALAGDDVFRFVVPADDALRVLLLAPDDARGEETLFFERALSIGRSPVLRVERRRTALDAGVLQRVGLVVLWDQPPPSAAAAAGALTAWIRDGGGLVIAAGRRLAARGGQASSLMPATIRGAADRLADRGGTLGEVSTEHPVFAPFRDAAAALGAARFLRYPRLEPAPGADVLARFDDGLPAVVERREGPGRVLLVAAPLDAQGGDFPLQPAYLPFLRRLAIHASGHEAIPLWHTTGENGLVRGDVQDPVVSAPGGEIRRIASDTTGCVVAFTEAGFYAVHDGRVAGEPKAVLAANPPPGESDLTPMDPRELLLGVRQTDTALAASASEPTARETEGRQRLWRVLLALAAAVLLTETLIANRGWRGTAGRIAAAPPERNES